MDSERDAKSAISDEDSDFPEYGKCKKLFLVSNHGIGALVAHEATEAAVAAAAITASLFKLDKKKLHDYIKAGYKTTKEKEGLLYAALTTDTVDEIYAASTREPSPDELMESDAEKEGWKLLENTLYEESGCWRTTPGSNDHDVLRRTVFQCWKAVERQSDRYEPSIPYHKIIYSTGIDEDLGETCVGHATHSGAETAWRRSLSASKKAD